jgi:hypothetical protein
MKHTFNQHFVNDFLKNQKTAAEREILKSDSFIGDCCVCADTGKFYVFDGRDFVVYEPNNQPILKIEKDEI